MERGYGVTQLSRRPLLALAHPLVTSIAWDARRDPFPAQSMPHALDGLAYCPGSIRLRPFERIKEEEWLEDFDLKLLGAVRAIQGAVKPLRKADRSAILLFSTVAVRLLDDAPLITGQILALDAGLSTLRVGP